jgi:microcompartment protein CcmK/EutM
LKIAQVVGNVVSTIKKEHLKGCKLMIVQPLDLSGNPQGAARIALDGADAGIGDIVLLNNDGGAAAMVIGDKKLIADDTIAGVIDCYTFDGKTTNLK